MTTDSGLLELAAAREAFEEEFKWDSNDPSKSTELDIWMRAWRAALAHQDDLIRAAYADAVDVCSEIMPPITPSTLAEIVAHGSGIGEMHGMNIASYPRRRPPQI